MHDLTHLVRARAATGVNDLMSTRTRTAVALLFVISFVCRSYTEDENKRIGKCSVCGMSTKDAGLTTSNFIRHLKIHPNREIIVIPMY